MLGKKRASNFHHNKEKKKNLFSYALCILHTVSDIAMKILLRFVTTHSLYSIGMEWLLVMG